MDKVILVVGATGMLGEPVARQLDADGYKVRILTRSPEKAKTKFGDSYEIVQGDVEQPDTLETALAGCYGVHINLAGSPKPESYDHIEHQGTTNVAQAASNAGTNHSTLLQR
jgi:uncharacterized protein YbjT (DUF2867 family)